MLPSKFSAAGNVALRCLAEDDEYSILRIAKRLGHYFCQGFRELPLLAQSDLRVEQIYSDCRQVLANHSRGLRHRPDSRSPACTLE